MPDNIIVKGGSLKGSDWNFLDYLKKLREKRKETEKDEKVSIVCNHILTAPLNSMTVVDLKVKPAHPKHDGHIYCCELCAFLFDKFNLSQATENFSAVNRKTFEKNIRTIKS